MGPVGNAATNDGMHPTADTPAYLLSGAARTVWEHSIPPMDELRYSITFRYMHEA